MDSNLTEYIVRVTNTSSPSGSASYASSNEIVPMTTSYTQPNSPRYIVTPPNIPARGPLTLPSDPRHILTPDNIPTRGPITLPTTIDTTPPVAPDRIWSLSTGPSSGQFGQLDASQPVRHVSTDIHGAAYHIFRYNNNQPNNSLYGPDWERIVEEHVRGPNAVPFWCEEAMFNARHREHARGLGSGDVNYVHSRSIQIALAVLLGIVCLSRIGIHIIETPIDSTPMTSDHRSHNRASNNTPNGARDRQIPFFVSPRSINRDAAKSIVINVGIRLII